VLATGCGSLPETETPPLSGAELFGQHCSACHGAQADGQGPVAQVMRVTVPELRSLSRRNGGIFPQDSVRAYIDGRELPPAHGDRYMPVWGQVLSFPDGQGEESGAPSERRIQSRITAIVDFLLTIQYE
jgi:mono/diheme cytochrome c family protein